MVYEKELLMCAMQQTGRRLGFRAWPRPPIRHCLPVLRLMLPHANIFVWSAPSIQTEESLARISLSHQPTLLDSVQLHAASGHRHTDTAVVDHLLMYFPYLLLIIHQSINLFPSSTDNNNADFAVTTNNTTAPKGIGQYLNSLIKHVKLNM